MKKYQTLLFDVDDTLLDFGAAEKGALNRLLEEQNLSLTIELEQNYQKINQGLWQAYEEGKLSRNEVVNTRFSLLFREYGKEVDGEVLEKSYRAYLNQGHQLVKGALELIKELYNDYDLFVVTNGVSKTQDMRLRDSGLYPFFKDIFVSEDTGFQKPMKEFFDYAFERIPNFNAEKTLIIGDSLNADIKGGQLSGLETCWFNGKLKQNNTEILPTYEIHRLEELYHILLEKEIQTVC